MTQPGSVGFSLVPRPLSPVALEVAGSAFVSAGQSAVRGKAPPSPPVDAGVWTGLRSRGSRALSLYDHCRSVIHGQDAALQPICLAVWSAEVELALPDDRPRGVYFAFGPTGVGKTETPKRIAAYLFQGKPAIIPLNEFGEENSGGRFKEALVRKLASEGHCRRVLVFDEVEKASRDAVDVLISILDEGRMLNSDGTYLSFREYHIWVTSNIGSSRLYTMSSDSSVSSIQTMRDFVFAEAAQTLRPELFARSDCQVFYAPLSDPVQREIMRENLDSKLVRISDLLGGVPIAVHESAIGKLVGLGFHDQKQGARGVRRLVNTMVNAAVNRACSDTVPPKPPLELRAGQGGHLGATLEFASRAASFGALAGAAFPGREPR